MARIADEEIERIKQNVSLLRLIESQGHTLKKEGNDFTMCCPFHEDKTPSLKVSSTKNLFNCFGCGAAGSVIDWVMKTQGVSFKHAAELLRKDLSLVAGSSAVVKDGTVRKLSAPITEDADKQTALKDVIAFYHGSFKENPEAHAYLKQRGLDDVELIEHFKLGYANRTLGLHLPHKNRQAGAKLRGLLQEVGIIRESGHEHFNGSLVVPVINDNQVLEVYGRKMLGSKLRKGTAQHLYLPGPHQGVFNRDGLIGDEIILCESLIDALTFWRWDFKHVTCSYGTNGFTDELLQCLIDKKVKRVLIAYDRDDAGNEAAEKLAKLLNKNSIDAYRILFPKGMDANEYALQVKPAQKSLGLVIRKAEPMGATLHTPNNPLAAGHAEAELETQATPIPPLPKASIPVEVKNNNEIFITLSDRLYRVKGFNPKAIDDQLKINLMVTRGEAFHMDKLDLYSSKHRQVFINQASVECGLPPEVIKTDLGKVLLQLETMQQNENQANEAPQAEKQLNQAEREAALTLLKQPDLLSRILADFNAAGVVGEETNKLVGYLACVSRKLDRPLAVMVQSSSAAGKSSLMDAILNLMPENERVQYSAMTGQSLFYMGETNLKNKILAISEEEGAHNASYALKLLQSEGEVTIASTGKDDNSGDLVTKEYRVEGPVMLFMTTTAIDIDEELMNRCLVLSVNESREQTQAIHAAQRKSRTLEGLQNKLQKQQITKLHQDAQQLIKPLHIINPYADQLTFLDDKTRTRRDHEKYLTLIDSIALLHQHQRTLKTVEHNGQLLEYIEVTLEDIEVANRLAHDVLGKTLDELPPQTRKLLKIIQKLVQCECDSHDIRQQDYRFTRKQIREYSGWGNTQIKVHCHRLEEMEYLLTHRGGRGQSFEYELLYQADVESSDKQLMGLIEVETLTYDAKKSGQKAKRSGASRPQVGAESAGGQDDPKRVNGKHSKQLDKQPLENDKNSYIAAKNGEPSYRTDTPTFTQETGTRAASAATPTTSNVEH